MRRPWRRQPLLVPHCMMMALVWARALEALALALDLARAKVGPPRLEVSTHCMKSSAPTRSPRMGA
eukprot:10269927-Prorocentrum_lima.AAC.1